jgi:hypothetical protein
MALNGSAGLGSVRSARRTQYMAARTTNSDIVGANDFAFANNLGHYRGQLAAKLAKHLVTHMATRRLDDPIEPMTLQNMRENGVRSLAVQCHQCRHEVVMNVDHLPGDLTVPSFGQRMVCTNAG